MIQDTRPKNVKVSTWLEKMRNYPILLNNYLINNNKLNKYCLYHVLLTIKQGWSLTELNNYTF